MNKSLKRLDMARVS